jgi:DNA polymerase-3 subunit beta
MEIKINRKEFCDAFVVGSQMAGKSKVLSVLDNAKVVIRGNNVYVTSNSVQCCVTKKVSLLYSDGDVDFLVNPNDLLKGLKSLRDNELTISISSVSLSIAHKRGRIEIPVMGAADFPMMDKVESSDVYTLDSARLSSWLNIARNFASTDELRPVMCGMLLYVRGGVIGACATDTRILFADSYETETGDDIECILPASSFTALQTLLRGTDSVAVSLNSKHISFKTSDARLTCQLQIGRFPDFNRVIPQGNDISVVMNTDDLVDAINRVGLFTDKSHSLVKMDIQGMVCRLTGSDLNLGKSATDECMCQHSGDDIKIGVSAEYLMKCIGSLSGGDIEMTFSEPNRPILFKDGANERMKMLMMPISLNE